MLAQRGFGSEWDSAARRPDGRLRENQPNLGDQSQLTAAAADGFAPPNEVKRAVAGPHWRTQIGDYFATTAFAAIIARS